MSENKISNNICRELRVINHETYQLRDPEKLSPDEMSLMLTKIKIFREWCEKVEEYALKQAVNNKTVYPGWKLQEGKTIQKFADDKINEVTSILNSLNVSPYKPPELKSVATLKREIGEINFKQKLAQFLAHKHGKMTLVTDIKGTYPNLSLAQ